MPHELELEVFRSGDYGHKGRWTEDDLDGIARDYDAALHEAPVTLDHAQSGPALGWVAGVRRAGDRLIARLRNLHADFIDLVKRGAFKKRSVELYRELPETGRPYLKAVSFLGAAAPAVKGLRDVLFDNSLEAETFEDEANAFSDLSDPSDPSDPADLSDPSDSADPANPADFPDLADSEPGVHERFAELRDELRRAGRWIPAWDSQGIEDFFRALNAIDEIPAAEGGDIAPAHWFAEFLRSMPAFLPMGEAAPPSRTSAASIPRGSHVSRSSIELHRRAAEMRERRPELSYAEALLECSKL